MSGWAPVSMVFSSGKTLAVNSRMLPLMVHPGRIQDEPLVAGIRDMADRVGVDSYLRQQRAIMTRIDFRPGLGEVRVPTAVSPLDGTTS